MTFPPTSGAPAGGAARTGAPTAFTPTSGAPAGGAARTGAPTAFTPTSGAPAGGAARTGAPTAFTPTTGAPAIGAPGTVAPGTVAPGTVAPATGAPAAVAAAARSAASSLSAAGSLGIGRLKGVATERVKANDAKVPVPGAPRKVRVLVSRIDPWSALKIGFLVSIAVGIMTVVAVHILWMTLNQMETFVTIQEWVTKLFAGGQEVNILQFFEYRKVMPATLLVAVVNVVLLSGLSVIGAFIYNTISRVVGGVYMTLTDD